MHKNISKSITTAVLAIGMLVSGFTASAASSISMTPLSQTVADGGLFSVDIMATGLPEYTDGGAVDVSWVAADMTLDSIWLATTDPGDNGGGVFLGPWDPVSSLLSGVDGTGAGSISGLYVGTFGELISGNVPIARLNFTLGTGVSNSVISMAAAAVGGTWSSTPDGEFFPTFAGATINPIPVPAALWLFGSGLIGLAGMARRRG